jgi:hypothetical protein
MAKADAAAKRVEYARSQKMQQGVSKMSQKFSTEQRIEREREAAKSELEKRREEALRIEAERVARAKEKASFEKAEQDRLQRQWEEQQQLRREQDEANKEVESVDQGNRFNSQQREGRTPAFIPKEQFKPRDSDMTSGIPQEANEESQPIVKPPTAKFQNPFQRRPTFTPPTKGSNLSESNEENGYSEYSSNSWQGQGIEEPIEETFDTNRSPSSESEYKNMNGNFDQTDVASSPDQTNTVPNGSAYQIQSPSTSAPDSSNGSQSPNTEETSTGSFNSVPSFVESSQDVTSNPNSSTEKADTPSNYDGSYFMNTNSDEAPPSFDYIQNWVSSNQGVSDQTDQSDETLNDSSTENDNNSNGAWFGGNGTPLNTNAPSTGPSTNAFAERSGSINKGGNYLENLSKPDSASSSGGVNGGGSYAGNASREVPSQPEAPSQPGNFFPERIKDAYRDWCQYYGKEYNSSRLSTFASNFLAVERYHRETGVSLILNELADMTSEEFRAK